MHKQLLIRVSLAHYSYTLITQHVYLISMSRLDNDTE